MKFEEFIEKVAGFPAIESEILLAGVSDQVALKVQIGRWVKSGKLIQLRRGLYLLAEPYRKEEINEFYIAGILQKPSYISLEKALEFHGLIPEGVPMYTVVTTKRPCKFITKAGVFEYKHLKTGLFWGYDSLVMNRQTVFIASREKALLDYFYLKHLKATPDYIEEMRLQNLDKVDLLRLSDYARKFNKPGIMLNAEKLADYIRNRIRENKIL